MLKKLIAGALSASLLVSAAVSGNLNSLVTEKHTPSDRTVQKSELSVEGSNSLGKMIGDAYSNQNADNIKPLSASFSEKRFEITDLNFDLDTGIVTVNSTQDMDCELIVSFIDDDNAADTIDIKTPLLKGENVLTELSVDTNRLPEFFNICAVLKDRNGYELSAKHNFNNYTRFKQKINSATVEDFDEEYVVNLDDDDTTNFFVLKEETVIAESSENTNTLVSADYDNDTYVFENIDDSIRNLKEGDYLYVRPNETDIIAVNVDNIRINGNRSEIKGTGNADDIFEFVKLEFDESDIDDVRSEKYNEDKTIKLENAQFSEEGAVLDYEIGDFSDEYKADDMMGIGSLPVMAEVAKVLVRQVPIGVNKEIELSHEFDPIGLNKNVDLVEVMTKMEDPLNHNFGAEASITSKLKIALKANINYFKYRQEVEIALDESLGATLKVGAKIEASYTFDLPPAFFSFYGIIDIGACPELKLEGNVEMYTSISFAVEFGCFYNNLLDEPFTLTGNIRKLTDEDKKIIGVAKLLGDIEESLVAAGEVSVTFDPCLGIWFVSKHAVSALVGMPITFSIKGENTNTNTGSEKVTDLINEITHVSKITSEEHYCKDCYKITTSVTFGINVKSYLPIVGEVKKDLAEKTYELGEYFYSPAAPGDKFGKGECPYKSKPVTIKVVGNDDYPSSGLTVIVDEEYETTTDENGKVSFYARPYSYSKKGNEKHYTVTSLSHSYAVKSGEEDLAKGNFTAVTPNTVIKVEITKTSKNNTINTNRQITTEPQPVTEPATEAPYTPLESVMGKVADEHKIQYAGKLGENIRYTIYKNGYMVIDGYGEMNRSAAVKGTFGTLTNFSSAEEKSLVKNVVIKDSKADLDQLLTEEYVLNLYIVDNAKDLVKAFNDSDKNEKNDIKYLGSLSSENEDTLKEYVNKNINYYEPLLTEYKESIRTEAEGQVITNIDDRLFSDCENLETVILPTNIETIGTSAFSGCKNLKSITYEGSPNAGKKAIDLPLSIKSIGDIAFNNCSSLVDALDLTGNSDLEKIGSKAFFGSGITSLIIPSTVKNVGQQAFGGCLKLSKATIYGSDEMSISTIFDNNTGLEEMTVYNLTDILNNVKCGDLCAYGDGSHHFHLFFYSLNYPDTLETIIVKNDEAIGTGAFRNMKQLKNIILPEKLKSIGNSSFSECNSLEKIEIPETVEEIGNNAFSNCSSLKTITIPDGIKSIPDGCFNGCTSLESIDLPESIDSIGSFAFSGTKEDRACYSLKSITIPSNVTVLPDSCFANCTGLEKVILSENIIQIPVNCFKNCKSLKSIVFPEGVQKIVSPGHVAEIVLGCDNLTEIYIPKTISFIAENSFGVTINDDFGTVYYGGTEEEWEALKKKQSVKSSNSYYTSEFNFNDSIFNANVIFNAKPEDMSSYVASQEEFVPSGDVNGNGKLDLGDALAILQYIANSSKYPLSEEAIKQADVYNTGDGITPMDALAIQRYDAGLIDSLPVYR